MYGFVYMTTCLINGKKYIGMCSREPIDKNGKIYLGSGSILKQAIRRYGRQNFIREILQESDSLDELSKAEEFWIEKFDAQNSNEFYNLTPGGMGGNSEYLKEIWIRRSDERRAEIGKKISKARLRLGLGVGRLNGMYGKSTSAMVQEIWNNRSKDERAIIGQKVSRTRKEKGLGKGTKNSMYGRSAVREHNLRWYTNGIENKYITEGTQPIGWRSGRVIKRR